MPDRPRVIVALPDVIECTTVAEWLVAGGFEPVRRPSLRAGAEEMRARAFDLLVADATFASRVGPLAASRQRNPLTPTVVLGNGVVADPRDNVSGQAMYLGRPIERGTFVCTVSMALMDSRPTRRSERKTANRFEAVVNGVPSHIIDISKDGLRLEMPRERLSVLPPYFSVRVPLIGIAVIVQRMWARPLPGQGTVPVTWYGGALTANRPGAEQGWRAFVDMIPVVGAPSSRVLKS